MSETQEAPPKLTTPVSERDHHIGPIDAPIVLVEYADIECPHCQEVHAIIRELVERMGDRICIVYRHFPISNQHPHAQKAAEAVEAAAAQGKFFEMLSKLYSNQDALEFDDLLRYAEEIEIDVERFKRELEEDVHADRVREDFMSGVRSGVNGTPSFYINGTRYDGAWDLESLIEAIDKPLGVQVSLLAQNFMRLAASGGIVLLIATIIALFWANSPWASTYFDFWHTELGFELGNFHLVEDLLHWVNDGLMVIFFFVVGLEIKREIQTGELASPRKAALPIMGAIGGMLVPALFYVFFTLGDPEAIRGWGVPVATDIAFTLGILTVLGSRAPLSLKVFFTALAIADDIGGILVIAIFYSEGISLLALGIALIFLLALGALNWGRVYNPLPYALLGIGLWLAFLQSGIHPTIAGVLLALTIPTRRPANTRPLLAQVQNVVEDFELAKQEESIRQPAVVQTLETILERMQSPAQRLERDLTPWSTYLILPIFALANAGVEINVNATQDLLSPVSLGIIFGLVVGKPVGITLLSWIAVRTGIAELPSDMHFKQLAGASFLAGIGFTLSLFIANSAFTDPEVLAVAKLGILVASILAGVLGWVALTVLSPVTTAHTQLEPATAD
ncbi:MAG: Na+/H+ antiporter NhaA [Chloroflexi bacterium]|nr:MAG: Na+/H+ antiporter NhaA [Chloroflexota bacterium]MBL1195742.1 Na+/H+ antiporter NhaA [Chloroflexota bacterium]NOH13031.1 Na+/H+ antiporter NhaA [Chloroflexota bacterium]